MIKIFLFFFIILINFIQLFLDLNNAYAVLPPKSLSPECIVEGTIIGIKRHIGLNTSFRPVQFKNILDFLTIKIDTVSYGSSGYYSGDLTCENTYTKNQIITVSANENNNFNDITYHPKRFQRVRFYVSKVRDITDNSIHNIIPIGIPNKGITYLEDSNQRDLFKDTLDMIILYGTFIYNLPFYLYFIVFNPTLTNIPIN